MLKYELGCELNYSIYGEGNWQISYRATVGLSPYCSDPSAVFEVQPADLPLGILYYLYPSRYCQSDGLLLAY